MTSTGATSRLAEFAARLTYDDLPQSLRDTLSGLLIDYFRVASAGREAPWVEKYRRGLSLSSGQLQASILYSDEKVDVVRAAGINGVIAGSLEWDDTHVGAMLHAGVVVWPAALAIGEKTGATGREILAAVVAGYETVIRTGLSVQPAHFRRGFQSTATCGAFGAAAASAKLLGLDAHGIRNALGIACSYAGGVTQFFLSGSEVKRIHAGKAASAWVESALFAASGLTGPFDAIEGKQGFANALAGTFNESAITSGLGTDWHMLRLQMKPHALSARVLAASEAAEQLVESGVNWRDIEKVVIGIPSVIQGRLTGNDPQDLQQAQMSAPFAVAMSLVFAQNKKGPLVIGYKECEQAVSDPEIRALSRQIICEIDPEIEALSNTEYVAARVTVTLRNGNQKTTLVPVPMGAPERPMPADDLLARFRAMSSGLIVPTALDAWMDGNARIDQKNWAHHVMSLRIREARP